ncbi:MAG: hypothetical protein Q8R28_22980, partial [Dehalococcoidia bacterium]|nr:hypothetical protein [Dehalococcoidia bacterium]
IDGAIRARLLERAEDSGPWPCDWSGAGNVRLRVPAEQPAMAPTPVRPAPAGKPWAEAELEPSELQDVADGLADVLKAGAGLDLRFVLRVEIGSQTEAKEEQITRLNQALKKACGKLQLETR